MDVRALVLCAGRGTRLRPLTHTWAKASLPVAGRPIWQHIFSYLAAHGFDEIGVVVGPGQEELARSVKRWSPQRVTVILQAEPAGIAHAVAAARPFLADQPFLLYLGDNLTNAELGSALRRFRAEAPSALITLQRVADPRTFGVAVLDGGRVTAVAEKPAEPPSDLAIAGIYFFSPEVHAAIAGLTPSARGELEITDAIARLIAGGRIVLGHELSGWWVDAGTAAGLLAANARLLEALAPGVDPTAVLEGVEMEGPVVVGPRAVLRRVRLRGPAFVGPGCRLTDAEVGPATSVGDGAELEGVRVWNSILLPGSRLAGPGLCLADSVVGAGATVSASPEGPATLVVGDGAHLAIPPRPR